jgi:hypothetical protein
MKSYFNAKKEINTVVFSAENKGKTYVSALIFSQVKKNIAWQINHS